jgi:integrase
MYRLRAKLPTGFEKFYIHDLRRSHRSSAGHTGVEPRIAERVLGHVTGSAVERIYDKFTYDDQKKVALERIAQLIWQIVHGSAPDDKVVPLRREA